MIDANRWRDIAAGGCDAAAGLRCFNGVLRRLLHLPISHTAVAIEDALRQLLLEWVLFNFSLVDFDSETGASAGTDDAALFFDRVAFVHDVVAPGNVGGDRFTNDVAGLREAKFEGGRGADWALGIVGRQGEAMGVSEGCDAPRLGKAAAVGDVELANIECAGSE